MHKATSEPGRSVHSGLEATQHTHRRAGEQPGLAGQALPTGQLGNKNNVPSGLTTVRKTQGSGNLYRCDGPLLPPFCLNCKCNVHTRSRLSPLQTPQLCLQTAHNLPGDNHKHTLQDAKCYLQGGLCVHEESRMTGIAEHPSTCSSHYVQTFIGPEGPKRPPGRTDFQIFLMLQLRHKQKVVF